MSSGIVLQEQMLLVPLVLVHTGSISKYGNNQHFPPWPLVCQIEGRPHRRFSPHRYFPFRLQPPRGIVLYRYDINVLDQPMGTAALDPPLTNCQIAKTVRYIRKPKLVGIGQPISKSLYHRLQQILTFLY
jgi:hypothetical protein